MPLPMVDSDYRIMNPVSLELAPLSKTGVPNKLPFESHVYVAYCPHISQVGSGAVTFANWAAWLKKNKTVALNAMERIDFPAA